MRHDARGAEAVGLPQQAHEEEEDEEDERQPRGVEEHLGLVQERQRCFCFVLFVDGLVGGLVGGQGWREANAMSRRLDAPR